MGARDNAGARDDACHPAHRGRARYLYLRPDGRTAQSASATVTRGCCGRTPRSRSARSACAPRAAGVRRRDCGTGRRRPARWPMRGRRPGAWAACPRSDDAAAGGRRAAAVDLVRRVDHDGHRGCGQLVLLPEPAQRAGELVEVGLADEVRDRGALALDDGVGLAAERPQVIGSALEVAFGPLGGESQVRAEVGDGLLEGVDPRGVGDRRRGRRGWR